ncbi:hypothetical protein BH09PSE1_BH09PSE1_05280 [soil metagenome]
MKLVACQLDVGGLIWINPEFVTTVQRHGPGTILVRFSAGQPQQMVQVKGEAQDLVTRLMEVQDSYDRRTGPTLTPGGSDALDLDNLRHDERSLLDPL